MLSLWVYFCLPHRRVGVCGMGSGALFPILQVDFFYPCNGGGRGGRCRVCLRLLYAGIIFSTRAVVGRGVGRLVGFKKLGCDILYCASHELIMRCCSDLYFGCASKAVHNSMLWVIETFFTY